jgi:Zn-dependent protease
VCALPTEQQTSRGPRITPIQWVGLAVLIVLFLWQLGLLDLGGGGLGGLQSRIPFFVALVVAITVHEFSHGLVATWFGDSTPRRAGRLTLNPLKHLDPIGTLLILVGPIGWGRPMPINPGEMRNSNLGWAMSSLAGPVSNVLTASIVVLALGFVTGSVDRTTILYINALIAVNVGLAVFNLLPIPPLDGFGFIFGLVPQQVKLALLPIHNYGPLILLAVLFLPPLRPFLDGFLNGGRELVYGFLEVISG